MVNPPDIAAAVTQAAREAVSAAPSAADRHIPELRVRAPPNATPAQFAAGTRAALAAALKADR